MAKTVFVFGSNEAGMHGAGAAKAAYEKHGARWGQGYGLSGDSFAIPTKDMDIRTLPLERIAQYTQGFLAFAAGMRKRTFKVTQIGCGLAGYKAEDIAPLFVGSTINVHFDTAWFEVLGDGYHYWGTQ